MADILSQEEIDSLLTAVSDGQLDIEGEQAPSKRVMVYDFRRPSRVSREQLRNIEMVHEAFCRELSTMLSGALRIVASVQVASVDELSFGEFIMSLENPTFLAVFDMRPLHGSAVLEINPDLSFAIIDRLLGGKGQSAKMDRGLTSIEQRILGKLTVRILGLLEKVWAKLVRVEAQLQRMESNPQFVQILPEHEMAITLSFNVTMGETRGVISMCLPDMTIEPVLQRLSGQQWAAASSVEDDGSAAEALLSHLRRSTVTCSAVLGRATLSVGQLVNLRAGDIIRLDTKPDGQVPFLVRGVPKFMGKPGIAGNHRAVKLTAAFGDDEE